MATRIDRFIADLEDKTDAWDVNIIQPYVRAYDTAYSNFERTLEQQRERNRMIAEMMVLSASILTGSFMMAAFATASMRTLVGRAGLAMICNNNLNRTFKAYHWAATNPAVSFAVGKVLDEVRDRLTEEAENRIAELGSIPQFTGLSPLSYSSVLTEFLVRNKMAVRAVAASIRDDNKLSPADKDRFVDRFEALPFCHTPERGAVDEARLSRKMELSFYMSHVLDSDHLATINQSYTPYGAQRTRSSRTPIRALPSSREYPNPSRDQVRPWSSATFQEIQYDNIGSEIRGRIDGLHRMVVGGPFFSDGCVLGSWLGCKATPQDLRFAERTLNALGRSTRPRLGTAFYSA